MNKFDIYSKDFFSIPCSKIHKNGLRTRANFVLYFDDFGAKYAMFKDAKKTTDLDLSFLDPKISNFMPKLLECLDGIYLRKLFEIRFFKSSETLSILMLYHTDISTLDIKALHEKVSKLVEFKTCIIFQARKQRIAYPDDILEHFTNGIRYNFNDECFIQPSLNMNEKMLEFAKNVALNRPRADLLELYCGYGNFTLVLASLFKKVLATELSKKNVEFLNKNCELNNIKNIKTARLKDSEVLQALNIEREFNRLKNINLNDYNFSHIMLDPPRAGLGECVNLAKKFDNIIYISCNPLTAKKDLEVLEVTHELKAYEMFDQFVNSEHLECGFYLEKRMS